MCDTGKGEENDTKSLIHLISKLQTLFDKVKTRVDINLAQIVVVGSQSSGKSSVLETLVGKDFLPRGVGIVTRRPLRLSLVTSDEEYAQFSHTNDIFTNYEDIRSEITKETERTCKNGGISSVAINLTIFSANVLTLTVVDLPGLTNLALPNQPKNMPKLIKSMVQSFIKNENTIILCICAANTDLANNDALQMAKMVDPTGKRTIPVLTKLDLMDRGTNARNVLDNNVYPVLHGYFAAINRSQSDINENKPMDICKQDEADFFKNCLCYRDIAHRLGSDYLQRYINKLLAEKVNSMLPSLRHNLLNERQKLSLFLSKYQYMNEIDGSLKNKEAIIQVITNIANKVSTDFKLDIEGLGNITTDEESTGVKINRIFHEQFSNDLKFEEENEMDIRKEIEVAIRNFHGLRVGIFIPDMAFETIVKVRIHQLVEPCMQCISEITSHIMESSLKYCKKYMQLYPNLFLETDSILTEKIRECELDCVYIVNRIMELQTSYVNNNHPAMAGVLKKTLKPVDDELQVEQVLISDYVKIPGLLPCMTESFFAQLTKSKIYLYSGGPNSCPEIEINLENVLMKISKLDLISIRWIKLYHIERDSLISHNMKNFKFNPSSDLKVLEWEKTLNRCGVFSAEAFKFDTQSRKSNTIDQTIGQTGNNNENSVAVSNCSPCNRVNIEIVRDLIEKYMSIVLEQLRDIIPKAVVSTIIDKMTTFLENSLLVKLIGLDKLKNLMKLSASEEQKVHEAIETMKTINEGIEMIKNLLVHR